MPALQLVAGALLVTFLFDNLPLPCIVLTPSIQQSNSSLNGASQPLVAFPRLLVGPAPNPEVDVDFLGLSVGTFFCGACSHPSSLSFKIICIPFTFLKGNREYRGLVLHDVVAWLSALAK